MVNFHDPAVIAQDSLAVTKLWHTLCGLYIWEFVTTLDHEWNVARGHLPYLWTIWVYSLARAATLLAVILGFIIMDSPGPINCQVTLSLMIVVSFLAVSASSLLIVLRVIATWEKNKVAMTAAIGIWCINIVFLIQGAARLRSVWIPAQQACVTPNTESSLLNLIAMLVTDIVLLLIMLGGLFRLRRHSRGASGLIQLLWKQGVIWLLLATAAEVPPVVFIVMNLNDPLNIMFQPPSWIVMTICATRMHRALVDFTSRTSDVTMFTTHENFQNNIFTVPEIKLVNATSIPVDRRDVTVPVVCEQYGTPRMGSDGWSISTNELDSRETE